MSSPKCVIIKEGRIPIVQSQPIPIPVDNYTKELTCNHCNCLFKVKYSTLHNTRDHDHCFRDSKDDVPWATCPTCKYQVNIY